MRKSFVFVVILFSVFMEGCADQVKNQKGEDINRGEIVDFDYDDGRWIVTFTNEAGDKEVHIYMERQGVVARLSRSDLMILTPAV